MLTFAESEHPIFRSTSPLSRGVLKSKGGGKLSYTSVPMGRRLKLFFAELFLLISSVFTEQSQICVEEYETLHERTGRPVVMGQSSTSFVPSVIKSEVPLDRHDRAHKDLLLQQYGERIEKLSQQDRLSKFCTDAGFLTTVEIGQSFMTKDTEEFSQFTDSVACREYTLPRDEENTKIGPVWEVTACCLQGKLWSGN